MITGRAYSDIYHTSTTNGQCPSDAVYNIKHATLYEKEDLSITVDKDMVEHAKDIFKLLFLT